MPYALDIHETRRVDDKVIQKYSVGGTELIVYEAWEPSEIMGRHSTITTIKGQWYGRVGTRYLPPEIESLPPGPERSIYVGKWHEDQYAEAYNLILQAFPEADIGRKSMGEITLLYSQIAGRTSPGCTKPWLPFPDPLGIVEKATQKAPLQLKDPIRRIIKGSSNPKGLRRCARCGKYKDVKYRPGTGVWLCDECFRLWS